MYWKEDVVPTQSRPRGPAGIFAFEVDQSKCVRADMRDVYILCFYFAMTTLTTVGYGDIGPLNSASANRVEEENTTLRVDTTKTTGAKKGELAGTEINADRI